jgi:hypothetical protein
MIRPGKLEEAQILTNLSLKSKRHWAYPEDRNSRVWSLM